MEGIKKLKISILILLLIGIISIIGSFLIATIEENEFIDEYGELTYEDQQTISDFYDNLTSYELHYMIIGYMYYAVIGGLFILLAKLWYLNKI